MDMAMFEPLTRYLENYQAFRKEQEQFLEKEILYAFSWMDLDGHGYISMENIRQMAREVLRLTDKQIDDMFEGIYLDDKGNLNYKMFLDKVHDHGLVFGILDEWTPEYGFRVWAS